jgi:hypothetical protein
MRETDILPEKEKKYIELVFSDETQSMLRDYCHRNGFDLTVSYSGETQTPEDFDFHTTIFYTETEHDVANKSFVIVPITDINPLHFSMFGTEENILVLEIESETLSKIRSYYEQRYDMKDSWPEYKPHITLSYSYSGDIPDTALPPGKKTIGASINIKSQD